MSPAVDVSAQLALAISLATGGMPALDAGPNALVVAPLISWTRTADLGFTETSWLHALHAHGKAAGYGALAGRVFKTSSGKYYIPLAADRIAIRALLRDPTAALRVAAAQSRAHAGRLEARITRAATMSELYMAHVLGCDAAATLITAAATNPGKTAAELLPELALAKPSLFFHRTTARSVDAVARTLRGAFEGGLARLAHSHAARPTRAAWHTSIQTAEHN